MQKPPDVTARAELTVFVSRHAPGDLREGVTERIRRVEGVIRVRDLDVHGLRPGLNDLTVDVTATVTIRPADGSDRRSAASVDEAAVAEQLADGFGVKRAAATIESIDDGRR
ncbi:hypothetical protein [Halegenticoccus tardaugens]|uniref:hypothetical protein n=1 Tax=Halegenticoccus tardaugens TaxID=2071624 RepID=UPI00100B6845|nr:hypothetical protein [Halegenticoccus tardaugens]